jgi:hypothetical protein
MKRNDDYDPLDALARRYEMPTLASDPVLWAKEELQIDMYSKTREILRLIEIVPKLAVPSCHDAGKSHTAALAAARFLARWPAGTARVITTAPTNHQVRGVLWNEINQLHSRAMGSLPGRVNQTEWWIGSYMAGIGRKPSDYAPETFQGFHAEHILIIIDEAGGVPDELWTGVDTLATNEGAHILAIGNPDDPQTEFKRVVEGAETADKNGNYNGWTVVHIPAWKTPNLSGEEVDPLLRRVLLTEEWVEDKRVKWGEDSALWASKVAAEFPDESQMTVIRVADVTFALQGLEQAAPQRFYHFNDVQLGIDIAASDTGDETVIRERRGQSLMRRWSVRSGEPEDVSALIVEAQMQSGATMLHVDATGVGFGFLSDIRHLIPGVAVLPFVAAGAAVAMKEFENRRAEAHWCVRDRLRKRELDFSQMENQDETVAQLTSIRYSIKKGKILVEPKDDVRKRIGRSPDDSDALLLAVLPPVGTGPVAATAHASTQQRALDEARRKSLLTALPPTVTPTIPRAVPERVEQPSGHGMGRRNRVHVLRARR